MTLSVPRSGTTPETEHPVRFDIDKRQQARLAQIMFENPHLVPMAQELLNSTLRIRQQSGSEADMDILKTELFDGLIDPRYIKLFDDKPNRQRGEAFVTLQRGFPKLNVVVDPRKKSVICISAWRTPNGKVETTTSQLFSDYLGIDRGSMTFDAYKGRLLTQIDGRQLFNQGPEALIQVVRNEAIIDRLRVSMSGKVKNCVAEVMQEGMAL